MSDSDLLTEEDKATGPSDSYHGGNPTPGQQAEIDQLEAAWRDSTHKDGGKQTRYTRRQKGIMGGVVGLLVGGSIGLGGIIQGPLQSMSLAKLLSNTFLGQNDGTFDSRIRRVYNMTTGQNEKNNLAPIASVIATRHLEAIRELGIDPKFETADGKGRAKIQSIEIDTATDQGKRLLGRAMFEGMDVPNAVDGKVRLNLRGTDGARYARALTNEMVDIAGKKGITGKIAQRRLKKLYGVNFHPLNVSKRKVEDISDHVRKRRGEMAKEVDEGTRTSNVGDPVGDDADGDGTTDPVDPDSSSGGDGIKDALDGIKNEPDPVVKKSKIKALRSSNLFKGSAGAAAVVAVMCAARDVGNNVQQYKMDNIIKPLIRLFNQKVAIGSQLQSMQDLDIHEANAANQSNYDEENNTSVFAGEPLMRARGESGGTDLDGSTKSQIRSAFSGEKAALFTAIDAIPFIGAACGVNSWFGNLPIIKQIGEVSNQVVGGLSSLATGKSIDDWMEELVAMLAGGTIDSLAEGGELGALLGFAGILTADGVAIPSGGVPLTGGQGYEWKQYLQREQVASMQSMSFSERMFSLDVPNSFANSFIAKATPYTSGSQSLANIATAGLSSFSSISQTILGAFTPHAQAQTVYGYDYGLPVYGIPVSQLEGERYENPYENIDRLEDNDFAKLREANEKWGKCFGNPLDDAGRIVDREVESYEDLDHEDCTNSYGNTDFQDYQMYILDNVAIKSMACYEGVDEASCEQVGFGGTASNGGGGGTLGISADGFVFPLKTTKDTITNNSASKWCHRSQNNCHHDYNAADIFAPTGTVVVAARGGTVVTARDNDNSSTGSRVTIKGDDGNLYYYAHMGDGTIKVRANDTVTAGQEIGQIGTRADAMGTDMHLHFDALPSSYSSRPGCSASQCGRYPFINVQPTLVEAFNTLP